MFTYCGQKETLSSYENRQKFQISDRKFEFFRLRSGGGPIENNTTIRMSFTPKSVPKPRPIIPSLNIKAAKGSFEAQTTTCLSFPKPTGISPVKSFKPQVRYRRPSAPCAKETTQKLSFTPLEIGAKENFPWAQKPAYR